MTDFANVDEALEHASGKLAYAVTVPSSGPATARTPGGEVGAWEQHCEARPGDEKLTFLASAVEPAPTLAQLDDAFFERMEDFRSRIPAVPQVAKNAKRVPSWAIQEASLKKVTGLSSNGGHPDVVGPQRDAIDQPLAAAEDAFKKFLADSSDLTTEGQHIRAYRLANSILMKARAAHATAEAAYESAKQTFTQTASRANAVALRAALVDMQAKGKALDTAESAYDRDRAPYDMARFHYYAAFAARSFIDQEGNIDSIATSDSNAFTWGIGFANAGGIPSLFKDLYNRPDSSDPREGVTVGKKAIQKLMHAAGYVVQPRSDGGGRYLFVDIESRRVRNFDHNDHGGITAFFGGKLVPRNRAFLNLMAWIARDPKTRPAVLWMQISNRLARYTDNGPWAKHVGTLNVYGFLAKIRHSVVPFSSVGAIVETAVRKAWAEIERDAAARQEKDRKFDWATYEKSLAEAIAAGDPVDAGAQPSLGTGGRVGNYRKRRVDLEAPSKERDVTIALGALQFVCHCYELTRLASVQLPIPRANDPKTWGERKVGAASTVYTQFETSWFNQQGARHWHRWLVELKPGTDTLAQLVRLDAPVVLRDVLAKRYPDAMVPPAKRVEATPRGKELSEELSRREALREPLLDKQHKLTQQLEEENANPAQRGSATHDWHEAELNTVTRELTAAEGPVMAPPKDQDHDWPAGALSWEALQGAYKVLYDKALAEVRGFYFVPDLPLGAAKGTKPETLPIGRCDEIWEYWPQAAEKIVAEPLHTRPKLFEIRYLFLGEDKKAWMTLTFSGGMPLEPHRETDPAATP